MDKLASAKLRYLHMTPRKVRLVAGTMRGKAVMEAEAQLMVQPRRAAQPLLKLLRSAVANAVNTKSLDANKLFVESLRVDQGPMVKKMFPRARGRGVTIQKKMSHITLTLIEREGGKAPRFVIPKKEVKKKDTESGGRNRATRGSKKEVKRGVKHSTTAIANPNISARPTGDK